MKLELFRNPSTEESTTGQLFVNGEFECYTLEDKVREVKYAGITAIPEGEYKVIITMSPRFKKRLPLLIDVPGFDGIRIHPGNDADDTEGCILVGQTISKDWIGSSRAAFSALFDKMQKAMDSGETITIIVASPK